MIGYNCFMEFKEWITKEYIKWRGDSVGNDRSITEFAEHIGVSQPLLNNWMAGKKKPGRKSLLRVEKQLPGVYAALGMPGPVVSVSEWLAEQSPDERKAFVIAWNEALDAMSAANTTIDAPMGLDLASRVLEKYGL